ncbi:hypothetical protein RRG08_044830 [Elysia crispata]|uniref:Uncharacterized protein n=1 Tax=Elysia crispata TaxID=231223 RepID=A0AAE1DNR3_9GAST|nr:hypothetical protein RRG08_044830 [Elysia crispata]
MSLLQLRTVSNFASSLECFSEPLRSTFQSPCLRYSADEKRLFSSSPTDGYLKVSGRTSYPTAISQTRKVPWRRTATLGRSTPDAKRLRSKRQSNINTREATEEVVATLPQAFSSSQ